MNKQELLRSLPKVDIVLELPVLEPYYAPLGRESVLGGVRSVIDIFRKRIMSGELRKSPSVDEVVGDCIVCLKALMKPHHYRVVNVTGIILNTSLGRAPLPKSVVEHITEGISGYCRLAAHPETGKRFDRDTLVGRMLAELFGAEAATFVNNNAAATYLILTALAKGKEVIVSRGQLVEIGGHFRIPDVLAASGAKLVEVGTTNRTHLRDYKNAITDNTGVILRVHTSNYRITGFTGMTPIDELAALAKEHNLICVDDIGSGQVVDFKRVGLPDDYPLKRSIDGGADIVCFSGDKLLGSVQAGIILGKDKLIQKMRSHPLARAFRVDKVTCLALEATARLYLNPETAWNEVPVLRMLSMPMDKLKRTAQRLCKQIPALLKPEVLEDNTFVGGGSLPDIDLRTWTIRISHPEMGADELSRQLRLGEPHVFSRIADDRVILDLRTLLPGDDKLLIEALGKLGVRK